MILTVLSAFASSWQVDPEVSSSFAGRGAETAVLGQWGGEGRVILGGPGGVVVHGWQGEVVVQVPLPASDLALVDLDADGKNELLVCGSQGLTVLRGAPGAVKDVPLVSQPCEQLALGSAGNVPLLMMRSGGSVYELTPNEGDLTVRALEGLTGIRSIAMNGNALAALGDRLYTRGGRGETFDVPPNAVAVTRDAGGWALAIGGDAPHLLRSNGVAVPLPYAPLGLTRGALERDGLFVPLDGPAFVAGFRPLQVYATAARVLALGDADADGCGDVLLAGSPLQLQLGRCDTSSSQELGAQASSDQPSTRPAVPDQPGDLPLGESWSVVEVPLNTTMALRVRDATGESNRFRLVSGPDGMVLREDGVLVFSPRSGQIGLWRVSIQVGDRYTGVVVKVPDPNAGQIVEAPPPVREEIDPRYRNNVRRTESSVNGFFGFRECMVGAGAAAGVSRNSRGTWSNVGLPDAIPSASPAILMSCTGGSKRFRWIFGVDSAPVFFYIAPSRRMNHILAGTFGLELHTPAFRVGPIVSAGLLIFGYGVRFQVTPFTTRKGSRHGFELRALTFPATPSIQGILTYNVAFGQF